MPASQPANFNLQEFSDAGLLLVGGRLYTYAYGTTAQKTAYTDPAGAVPHTYTADGAGGQYIALNARGELPTPLYLAAGSYDLTLKRADGSLVWTRKADGIDSPSNGVLAALVAAAGALLVGFIQAAVGAVMRTLQSKNRDVVSACDFMTQELIDDAMSGNPVLDHTVALQNWINHCVTKHRKGINPTWLCRITAPLMIDRQVDNLSYDDYLELDGGGIYVDTPINMFSSTIVSAVAPVSQLIRWRNTRFVASNNALAAYVLDGIKFLRSEFVDCDFSKIKALSSARYVQSIYFYNCNARRWAGKFFQCAPQGYDIQVIGGLYEAGSGDCFDIKAPIGCKFWTQIEGMSGTALILNGAQGVDISCYFEANGLDFDCRTGGLPNNGINIHGCVASHANATYSFKWGTCYGCVSSGNWHTYNMHDLQLDSLVDINDQAQFSLSNADARTNIGYREGVTPALVIRGGGSASYTITNLTPKYTRIGNRMNIEFVCTMTSTAVNAADNIYIPSLFPTPAATPGMICGHVEVAGSTTSTNGISPLFISSAAPMQVQSSLIVIPANVAGAAWTVRGQISYQAAS